MRVEFPYRKRMLFFGVVFCLATAFADKVQNEPIYTVDLAAPASNLLSAVTITKTVDGETAASSYAELQAETAAGTLVKKGKGWLVVNEALANWTGQIHVDEGVLQVTCRGGLGKEAVPASKTSTTYATDADATFVASGATLFMDSSLLDKKERNESKKIVFEGEGAEGLGGAVRHGQACLRRGGDDRTLRRGGTAAGGRRGGHGNGGHRRQARVCDGLGSQ